MFTVLSAFTLEKKDAPPAENPPVVYVKKNGGKIESGSERHWCCTHSAPSADSPPGRKEGQMSEVQSEKSLLRGRARNCCANSHAKKKQTMCFIYILQNYTNIETCSVAHFSCLPLAQAPFLYFSRLHLIFQPHGQ